MRTTTPMLRCRHGIDGDTCPSCMQDRRDEYEAIELAARDHVTVERWRAEFDARLAAGCLKTEGAAS